MRTRPVLPRTLDDRPTRTLIVVATGVLLILAVWSAAQLWVIVDSHRFGFGVDFNQYQDHVSRWFTTGQFYLPRQLAGPTTVIDGDPLYPPLVLYLLIPFRVLPTFLWWAIPIGTTAVVMIRLRPVAWTWPILALIAFWPRTPALIYYGNPGMWAVAAVAAGVMWRWPSPLILFKPSLGPFALVGIGSRAWFACLGLVVVASVPFLTLWVDYAKVLANSSPPLVYSLLDLPITIAPLVAWAGRSDPSVGWNPKVRWPGRPQKATGSDVVGPVDAGRTDRHAERDERQP